MSNALNVTIPEGAPFIEFTREFDFPVAAVFEAHRNPEIVAQWLGPDDMKIEVDHYDFRTGGSYKYTHTDHTGSYGFSGVFHKVRENEFALQTFEFDGFPDVVAMDYMHFETLADNRCRLVGHSVYPSQEARDGMVASGMEVGLSQGYQRLDALLANR
ncbi:SRPBCC family protein [Paeniglutamicibacter terrestris]|uniref:SRPBCC family protein n=1 Tax=Paeniglutamicibacter terrestris TaxID=2723403 RepID=A0ABX1G7X6_9MICC|nr:SRPBCC family protein [Paeniglutamicibacter terrestris]ASN40355.1 polyketide cyclase [Arthrobacter sp. 7749]NKG21750.1 SRPBCC family protein [Paeniglutamicibacter terrestris]